MNIPNYLKRGALYSGIALITMLSPITAVAGSQLSSGLSDVDAIRAEVKAEPTTAETEESRRSALLRWWRLMWRSGQDMTPFDGLANELLNAPPASAVNRAAVDRGYAVMEEMLKHPEFIPEQKGNLSPHKGSATDWPIYMGPDGHNNGYSPDSGPSEGKIAWRFPKGYTWNVVPVIEDGRVYLASPGIDVVGFCLDESTGEILWRARQFGERFYGTPTTESDPVISGEHMLVRFGSNSQGFKIYSKTTGKRVDSAAGTQGGNGSHFTYGRGERTVVLGDGQNGMDIWAYSHKGKLSGEPQLNDKSVFAAGFDGTVFKFHVDSKTPEWRIELPVRIKGKLSVGSDAVYAGGDGSVLYALDKSDGSVLWAFDTGNPESRADQYFSSVLEDDGRAYFGTASQELFCVDTTDGKLIWKHSVSDWVRARPVKKGNLVYAATLDSRLYALEESGSSVSEKWVQSLGSHGITADLVAGEKGILGSGRDLIMYSVDYETGNINWRHGILDGAWIGGKFVKADYKAALPGSPTVVDGVVYIGGPDGFVNALDAQTGEEIWKFEAGAKVSAAVSLIDGKAMFGRIAAPFNQQREEEAPPYFAVDQKTGEPIWTSHEFGNVWIGAIYRNGVMFVGDMSGNVYGVDPDTGEKLWEYYTSANTPQENKPHDHFVHGWPPGVYCLPAADEECFYTGSWSGYYFAFEHKTGKLRWRAQTGFNENLGGLPDSAAPTLHKNYLYVQKAGHILAAINLQSGEIDWEWTAPMGWLQNGTLAGLGDKVYGSVGRRFTHIPYNSWIHAFADVESGSELLWSHRDGGGLTAPVVTDKQLMFGSTTGMFITSLNPETGELLWRVFTGGEMTENVPAIYGDMLFSVSKNGWLNAVK